MSPRFDTMLVICTRRIGDVLLATAAVRAATSPSLSTISRGSSGFPVRLAGHAAVQRPHIVHASVSKSCFQVNSPTLEAPTVSMSAASSRFGISRIAPLWRS